MKDIFRLNFGQFKFQILKRDFWQFSSRKSIAKKSQNSAYWQPSLRDNTWPNSSRDFIPWDENLRAGQPDGRSLGTFRNYLFKTHYIADFCSDHISFIVITNLKFGWFQFWNSIVSWSFSQFIRVHFRSFQGQKETI